MEQINLYPNQANYGNLPQEFTSIIKVIPLEQSFYTSLSTSLLLQLCRLKSIPECQELAQNLSRIINQGLTAIQAPALTEVAKYFDGFLKYIYQYNFTEYEKFIHQYISYMPSISRVLVAQLLILKGLTSEANEVISNRNLPSDDQMVMSSISEILNIAIEVYYGNAKKIYCQSKAPGTKILLIFYQISNGSTNEYSMPTHNLFNEFSRTNDTRILAGYPFCYNHSVVQSPPVSLSHPPGLPKDALSQPMNVDTNSNTPSSKLLEKLLKIITERNWRFSEAQVIELKPLLKNLSKLDKYSESALGLNRLLKEKLCDHSFINYSTLSCKKSHCIKCLNDEIELKSLNPNQVFCQCKLRLSDAEIKYYFNFTQPLKNPVKPAENIISPPITDHQMHSAPEIDQPMHPAPVVEHQVYSAPMQVSNPPQAPPVNTSNYPPSYSQPDHSKTSGAYLNPTTYNLSNFPAPQVPNPGSGFPNSRLPVSMPPQNPGPSNISLARPKFCYKCTNPIPADNQVQVDGRFYHKTCVKS